MTSYEGIQLTPSLAEGEEGRAVTVLQAYYSPLSGIDTGFTGGAWDTFDPSGTRAASVNTFTADDLVSCSLLATPIPGRAAVELLHLQRRRFEELLGRVGRDADFVGLESTHVEPFASVRALYGALVQLPYIGETRATKLLARKRPRLVPIVDTVVRSAVFGGAREQWESLRFALRADDHRLWRRLLELRAASGITEEVSPLRVFDVLAWMDGSGNAERALLGQEIIEDSTAGE